MKIRQLIDHFHKKGIKINSEDRKNMLLPAVGENFEIKGMIYKVVYAAANPLRFTAEPVEINVIPKNRRWLVSLAIFYKYVRYKIHSIKSEYQYRKAMKKKGIQV